MTQKHIFAQRGSYYSGVYLVLQACRHCNYSTNSDLRQAWIESEDTLFGFNCEFIPPSETLDRKSITDGTVQGGNRIYLYYQSHIARLDYIGLRTC